MDLKLVRPAGDPGAQVSARVMRWAVVGVVVAVFVAALIVTLLSW